VEAERRRVRRLTHVLLAAARKVDEFRESALVAADNLERFWAFEEFNGERAT
jgi:hypothetical protein